MESAQQTREERAKQIELLKIKRALNDAELAMLYKRFLPSREKSPESSTTVAPEASTKQLELNDAQIAILTERILATVERSPEASTTVVPEASPKAEYEVRVPNANPVMNDADNADNDDNDENGKTSIITLELQNGELVHISDGAPWKRLVSAVVSNQPTMDIGIFLQYMNGWVKSAAIFMAFYSMYKALVKVAFVLCSSTMDPNQDLVHTIGPLDIYTPQAASQSGSVVNAVFANSERTKTRVVRKGVAHRGE